MAKPQPLDFGLALLYEARLNSKQRAEALAGIPGAGVTAGANFT
ncbi:MAG TPA: hypothetical protein VKA12_04135 [Roseiarcus sp.]|nr:hypothetical protein [Roseiarcus sp.]